MRTSDHRSITLPARTRFGLETGFDLQAFNSAIDDPQSMELDIELPEVCVPHGARALRLHNRVIVFYRTPRGLAQATPSEMARNAARAIFRYNSARPISASLHGSWPECDRCIRRKRRFRWMGAIIALPGLLLIAYLFAAPQVGANIPTWIFFVLFPGWLPFCLVITGLLFVNSHPKVRIAPITDTSSITVQAHPNFAAALE